MELDRSENTNRVHPLSAFSSSSEDSTEEANFLPIQTIPTDFVSLINVTKLGSVSSDKAMPNSAPSGSTTHTATHQGGNTDKKEIYGNSQSSIQSPSSEIDIRQNIYVNGMYLLLIFAVNRIFLT